MFFTIHQFAKRVNQVRIYLTFCSTLCESFQRDNRPVHHFQDIIEHNYDCGAIFRFCLLIVPIWIHSKKFSQKLNENSKLHLVIETFHSEEVFNFKIYFKRFLQIFDIVFGIKDITLHSKQNYIYWICIFIVGNAWRHNHGNIILYVMSNSQAILMIN
jgi:hypothetical protein